MTAWGTGLVVAIMLVLWRPVPGEADTMYLKSGERVSGTVVEEDDDSVTIKLEDGGTVPYWHDEIERIERNEGDALAVRGQGEALELATPEMVAEAYFSATRNQQWERVGHLMHPEALDQFREMMLPVISVLLKLGNRQEGFLAGFADLTDEAALDELDARELYVRFFRGWTQSNPKIVEALKNADIDTIGHVREGPDLSHVVVRLSASTQGVAFKKMELVSEKRHGDEWRLLLGAEIEGLAQILQRAKAGLVEREQQGQN